jgi:hypothetical protein
LLLIGNKNDCAENKAIEADQGRSYASQKGMEFFEASAKTSDQV